MAPIHFHAFIGSKGHILWWQMTIRAVLIFVYGLVMVRFAARRVFGQSTALDIILAVLVGSNLSRALTANAPFLPTLAATAGMVLVYWALAYAAIRSRLISWMVKGRPVRLVTAGRIHHHRMREMGIGRRELNEAMRESGIENLGDVKQAYLEPDGSISIITT